MQHDHPMPFGAQVEDDGRVRFRLWAPGARAVDLCLIDGSGETILPMSPEPAGWFGLTTDLAGPGSRYLYRIDQGMRVPDPASRYQPEDVHEPSEVVEPRAWAWTDDDWQGRPWEEAVLYELHLGTFNARPGVGGTLGSLIERLDHLADLVPADPIRGRYHIRLSSGERTIPARRARGCASSRCAKREPEPQMSTATLS